MPNESADEQQALLERLLGRFDNACRRLAQTSSFAKFTHSTEVLEIARRLLAVPGGVEALYSRIGDLEAAGIFLGSDWEQPGSLQSAMAATTLKLSSDGTLILECLSELRFAAIMNREIESGELSPEEARQFLARVLALNLRLVFGGRLHESERLRPGRAAELVQRHQRFVATMVGLGEVLEELINEIWRMLAQRPIDVSDVTEMITNVAVYLHSGEHEVPAVNARGAERLISALYGPTRGCQEDPGVEPYRERLSGMDEQALRNEALGFSRSMHDTGLVSPYHPVFLRHALEYASDLVPATLGLSSTGAEALSCYTELVHELIRQAVWPETAQAVYGLAELLERGVLYHGPVAPALWRQVHLKLCPQAEAFLGGGSGTRPSPRTRLLAGVLNVLGQPRGIGQGDNPTCQAARALSMWSTNDPDYLLQVVAWAARDNDVINHFEGHRLSSAALFDAGALKSYHDVEPVSAVTVPHLDAIYMEMGRMCVARNDDPHRWINPEFHGWWVGRGFAIAVDVPTGALVDMERFIRRFHACYHPLYNGNNPVIHPQPAGIAVTDASGAFVGWHAISVERVTMDPEGQVRVYFFNPNNDSTQDWGQGVMVSTEGSGERYGESSLPFEQFVSRLYIFHYDPREEAEDAQVPDEAVERVMAMVRSSWGAKRQVLDSAPGQ